MKKQLFLIGALGVVILSVPFMGRAQILLSEIAWMGTDSDDTGEWIELYNFSNSMADLAGWELTSDDNSITIPLSGTLPPHGVGLLERENDDVISDIAAILTYSGEMIDAGTIITLKAPGGSVADEAVGGSNWSGIGGSNATPKKTAQRTRMGTWVTAGPTPGLDNAQEDDVIVTATPRPTSNTGGGSKTTKKLLSITASTTVSVGQQTNFLAVLPGLTKHQKNNTAYNWNFGDMYTGTGASTTHTYNFEGQYVVMVEASSTKKIQNARFDITVLPQPLSLSLTKENDVAITNESEEELTLDGYTISASDFLFIFPKNSILKSKAMITLPRTRIGSANEVQIKNTLDEVVTSLSLDTTANP